MGSDVTLTCSVEMGQNVLPAELSLLMVNASITKPDGTVLVLSNPVTEGTAYKLTTPVNSFGDSDVGNYTCSVTVKPKFTSTFLTGMGQLVSNPLNIEIGMAIPSLPHFVGMCVFVLVPPSTSPPAATATTQPPGNELNSDSGAGGGSNTGAIAGSVIVVVIIALIAVAVSLIFFIFWFV